MSFQRVGLRSSAFGLGSLYFVLCTLIANQRYPINPRISKTKDHLGKLTYGKWFLIVLLTLLSSCSRKPNGPLAYVTNERDGTLTVIDTATERVVSTIKVGARPRGIQLGPDRKTIWVALSYPTNQSQGEDKIAVIDIATGAITKKFDAGTDPEQFVVNKDGSRLYIANEDAGTASVTDTTANKVIAAMPVGLEPEGVALSPDGRWVYITSESSSTVAVLDTQTNQILKTFLVGARPREAVFTPDGTRAYVTAENGDNVCVIDVKDHSVSGKIELPHDNNGSALKPKGAVISKDGQKIYVATGRGNCVAVIEAATQKVLQLIPTGQRPWGIAFTPDGSKLYTANGLSNDVSVIDVASNKVTNTIRAGDGPWGVVIAP